MPLYDFACRACGHRFELLVRPSTQPTCPTCNGADLERLLSLPAIKSEGTKALAMRAAQKRDAKQGHERVQEQIRYELSHD
jgi:putative FmdB family regulatory protein